jgi:hypothetical protein
VRIETVLLVIRSNGRILLRRREDSAGIMAGFWELPEQAHAPTARLGKCYGSVRHTITHHRYTFIVFAATLRAAGDGFAWWEPDQLGALPVTTSTRKSLELCGIFRPTPQ